MPRRNLDELETRCRELDRVQPQRHLERTCLLCARAALSDELRCGVCGGYLLAEDASVRFSPPGYDRRSAA